MKNFKVTYYDGTGDKMMFLRAKSINEAISRANDSLRKSKLIGATVKHAEPCKAYEVPHASNLGDQVLILNGTDSVELFTRFRELHEIVDEEKKMIEKYTRSHPIKDPKRIETMLKRRK